MTSEKSFLVLAAVHVNGKELLKKAFNVRRWQELEALVREQCPAVATCILARTLRYSEDFDEYLDITNESTQMRDRYKLLFEGGPVQTAEKTEERMAEFSVPVPTLTSGRIAIGAPLKPEEAEVSGMTEEKLKEMSQIFGKDGDDSKLNHYQQELNNAAFLAAKEMPHLLHRRGELLKEARLRLHASGYVYKRGNASRSKVFGKMEVSERNTTMLTAAEGRIVIVEPLKSKEAEICGMTEEKLKEMAQIFGKDGDDSKLNQYQQELNNAAFLAAKEMPHLLHRRGELLKEARLRLHAAGYVYKRGNASRSKVFGKTKESGRKEPAKMNRRKYKKHSVREIKKELESLEKQLELNVRGKEKGVGGGRCEQAAAFEEKARDMQREASEQKEKLVTSAKRKQKRAAAKSKRQILTLTMGRKERRGSELVEVEGDRGTEADREMTGKGAEDGEVLEEFAAEVEVTSMPSAGDSDEQAMEIVMEMTAPPLHEALKPLSWLLGTWESEKADGFFPTIKPFSYRETVEFSHIGQPMLICSFRSRTPEGAPKHYERGFLRIKPGTNQVAYIASHNIGIAEVEEGEVSGSELHLESTAISNMSFGSEPRTTKIARVFKLIDESTLGQIVSMATSTTPELTPHLSAFYKKTK